MIIIDKRLMDEINSNKYKPGEVIRIAESLGISATSDDFTGMDIRGSKRKDIDSSIEAD
jgi:hypothetical protein